MAGPDKPSTEQYNTLMSDLLNDEGIIRYKDAYSYAKSAIENLREEYTDFFSSRFQYVFVDEYQDCDEVQRQAIDSIFHPKKCVVFKFGDPDQAIYNYDSSEIAEWIPQSGFLSISTSYRYGQEIANVICKLKIYEKNIVTSLGMTNIKPVLLVFDIGRINRVLIEFINILEKYDILDSKGVYKAIGVVKKESTSGLKIGSYWPRFDGSVMEKNEHKYWGLLDEIVNELLKGRLYKTEYLVRKLLCKIFHYVKIKNNVSGKEFTTNTIKKFLDDEHRNIYRQLIYDLSLLQNIERETINDVISENLNKLLKNMNFYSEDVFACLPEHFLDKDYVVNLTEECEKNMFIDSQSGCRIKFDTIHGVKGETHDATLYLETDWKRASDLSRILPYYGIGKLGKTTLENYSRKLAYVGMSRPKKMLCVAMQSKTYEKSKGVFAADWDIIDLRGEK